MFIYIKIQNFYLETHIVLSLTCRPASTSPLHQLTYLIFVRTPHPCCPPLLPLPLCPPLSFSPNCGLHRIHILWLFSLPAIAGIRLPFPLLFGSDVALLALSTLLPLKPVNSLALALAPMKLGS